LPEIVSQIWHGRDEAKRQGNKPLSQALKIIMNAFYGVLGTTACRFFDPRLASSIACRKLLAKSGTGAMKPNVRVINRSRRRLKSL
ncbi:hypothetical protein K6T53_23845, partial [Escherichia coli]|nr:hypothetical protein [Escherichia coli]